MYSCSTRKEYNRQTRLFSIVSSPRFSYVMEISTELTAFLLLFSFFRRLSHFFRTFSFCCCFVLIHTQCFIILQIGFSFRLNLPLLYSFFLHFRHQLIFFFNLLLFLFHFPYTCFFHQKCFFAKFLSFLFSFNHFFFFFKFFLFSLSFCFSFTVFHFSVSFFVQIEFSSKFLFFPQPFHAFLPFVFPLFILFS